VSDLRDIGLSECSIHYHDDGEMSATLASADGTRRVVVSGKALGSFLEARNGIAKAVDECKVVVDSLLNPKGVSGDS